MTAGPPPPRRSVPAPTVAPSLETVRLAFRSVRDAEATLKAEVERMALADDLDGLLELMGEVLDVKTVVAHMERVVGEACVVVVPSTREKFPIPGGGTFRVSQASAKKRVDHPGVISAVSERIAKDSGIKAIVTETGEEADIGGVVRAVVDTVAAATGATVPSFTGWRTGALKALGVDLNRFTEWEDAPLKPRIEGREAP